MTPEAPREIQFVLESLDHKLVAASQILSVNDFSLSTIEAILLTQRGIDKLTTRNEILNTVIRNLLLLKSSASRALHGNGKQTLVTDFDFTFQEVNGEVILWNPKQEPKRIATFKPNQRHSLVSYSSETPESKYQESWTIVHIDEEQKAGVYLTREYGQERWNITTHLMIKDNGEDKLSPIQMLELAIRETESGAILSKLLDLQVSE